MIYLYLFTVLTAIYCIWAIKKIRSSEEVKTITLPTPVGFATEAYSDNKKLDLIIASMELLIPVEFILIVISLLSIFV